MGFLLFLPAGVAAGLPGENAPMVARIAHVEGQLFRYVPEEEDWVLTVQDAPVGVGDILYCGEPCRSEIQFPGQVFLRLNESAQVEVVALEQDLVQFHLAAGQARCLNRSRETTVRAETPFGDLVAPPDTGFDLYVGEESLEAIALEGTVRFIHAGDGYETLYELPRGDSSLLADRENVEAGEGETDPVWDEWNVRRDDMGRRRYAVRSEHLPEVLQGDAEALRDNGRWERVAYQGQTHIFWHPVRVAPGWSPFTCGRWTTWYGDHVWIPYEPFGYVTHHFGHWVLVNGLWYWAPPGILVPGTAVHWHPGRVAWFFNDSHIGWFPLAPYETYYGHRVWGPHSAAAHRANVEAIHLRNYAHFGHPVVVKTSDFYSVERRYRVVSEVERRLVVREARPLTVVDGTVWKNVPRPKDRHRFVDDEPQRKPHRTVVEKFKGWERTRKLRGGTGVAKDLERAKAGRMAREGKVKPLRVTDRLVSPDDTHRPQVMFRQRALKANRVEPRDRTPPGRSRESAGGPQPPETERREREGKDEPKAPRAPSSGVEKSREAPERPAERPRARPLREEGSTPQSPSPWRQPDPPFSPARPQPAQPAPTEKVQPQAPTPLRPEPSARPSPSPSTVPPQTSPIPKPQMQPPPVPRAAPPAPPPPKPQEPSGKGKRKGEKEEEKKP